MQVVKYSNIAKRILFYWSKLFSSQIVEGNNYSSLNKTITILIADFELDVAKDIPRIHTKWSIREDDYSTICLTNVMEIHIIELPKLVKKLTVSKRDNKNLKLWLKFILSPDEIGEKDMDENKEIKKAKKELDKIKQDKSEQERALRRMMYVMDQQAIQQYGYEQGIQQGIQQGSQQTQIDIVKKLLNLNISIEKIAQATGLSKEEIRKLKN